MEAARDLIVEAGLDSVSLRRLARRLGVTAPALYAHVRDKHDLLRAVAEIEFTSLVDRFGTVRTEDPVERLRQLSHAYIAHARENPELFRVMFLFPPELGGAATATGLELPAATKAFELPAAAALAAINSGSLRADADPLLVALTIWAAIHGTAIVLQLGFGFGSDLEEQLIDSVIDTLIRGSQS